MMANQIWVLTKITNNKTCYVANAFLQKASDKAFNFIFCRLQDQAQRQLKKGGKFEDLSAGDCRPSVLIERYDNCTRKRGWMLWMSSMSWNLLTSWMITETLKTKSSSQLSW